MPNLRGASPIGRGDEGRSYAARTVGGDESGGRCRGTGGVRVGVEVDYSRIHHGNEVIGSTSIRQTGRR